MTSSEPAGRSPRPGPRTWRAAVVLFLTVLLGGLGLSGAQALWSQTGNVTAQVSTGRWVDYTRPGFSLPLTVSVDPAERVPWSPGRRSIRLSWSSATELDPAAHRVTYQVEAKEIGKLRMRGDALPYQGAAPEVTFQTTTPLLGFPPEHLRITVTPCVDGVRGTPTVKDLWLDSAGNTWLVDVPPSG